jgi:predicted hotdog family 3-hydroxylacyl-ACP dehydratase
MKLDRAWIAAHIAHQGSMCLLDCVDMWSEDEVICRALSHRSVDNPLRAGGRLGMSSGIEFAAQAMAVHGALRAKNNALPTVGFLTSVRDVRWHRDRLDDIASDLVVHVVRISDNQTSMLYQFSLRANDTVLLSGRASILIKAPEA